MNILRFAELMQAKYADLGSLVQTIRQDLLNAYRLYVSPKTAKEPVLQMLADVGEPYSITVLGIMDQIIAELNDLSADDLFAKINKLLGFITEMKSSHAVRNFIHEHMPLRNETDRRHRENVKRKLETVLQRLSGVLEKQAKLLVKLLPKEVPLKGGLVEPTREALSKDKLRRFTLTPAAQQLGLDDLEMMTKLLQYPEVKSKITTIINALDRGHSPIDSKEIQDLTREIKDIYSTRSQTNFPTTETEELS